MNKSFKFKAKVSMYQGDSPWYFVTLPKKTADEINYYFAHVKRGWGSLPVKATIYETIWKTSIFPDTKIQSHILPLKKGVRKNLGINAGNSVNFSLTISD